MIKFQDEWAIIGASKNSKNKTWNISYCVVRRSVKLAAKPGKQLKGFFLHPQPFFSHLFHCFLSFKTFVPNAVADGSVVMKACPLENVWPWIFFIFQSKLEMLFLAENISIICQKFKQIIIIFFLFYFLVIITCNHVKWNWKIMCDNQEILCSTK